MAGRSEGSLTRRLRLGLVGKDIAHSRSPLLHTEMLRMAGRDGSFSLLECPNEASLGAALDDLRSGALCGLNVTTPWKAQAAAACAAFVDGTGTRQDGPAPWPVNTLFLREGLVCGASTDGPGLCDALRWRGIDLQGRRVVLLGCGGAGQSVAADLLRAGVDHLLLCNRDGAVAVNLAQRLKDPRATTWRWGDGESLARADLVLHATRLGHGGKGGASDVQSELDWLPWRDWRGTPALLFDLGYAAQDTAVQALALREGLGAAVLRGSGQAMLAAQAARSFALWTGVTVDARELLRAVLPEAYQLYMSAP